MDTIHKFYLNDAYVVLDIASGSVHLVEEVVYTIIDDVKNLTEEEIFR